LLHKTSEEPARAKSNKKGGQQALFCAGAIHRMPGVEKWSERIEPIPQTTWKKRRVS